MLPVPAAAAALPLHAAALSPPLTATQFRAWKVDVKGRFPLLFIERKRGAVKEIFQAVLQEGLAATLTRKARAKEELYREAAADTTTTTAADGGGTVTEIRVDSGRPPQRVRTVRRGRRGGPGTTDASDEQPPQPQYEYEEPLYYDYDYSYEPTGDSGTRSDGDATETAADTASAGSASDSLGQRQQRRRPRRKKPQQQAQQQRSAIEVLADEMHKLLRKAGADLPEEPIVAASRRMQQASQIAGQP